MMPITHIICPEPLSCISVHFMLAAVKVYETKKNGKIVTKFKLTTRCGGLFTLTCDHPTAMKFEKALPPSVIQDIRRVKKATKARN